MNTKSVLAILKASLKKQWFFISVFAAVTFFSLLLMTGITIFTNRVYVTDGENIRCFLTTDEDIDNILSDNGYEISTDDIVEFDGFNDNIGNITILRAFDVKVTCDSQTKEIPIAKGTVSDVLKKAEITVNDDDLMNIGMSEEVNSNTNIIIQRVTFEETTTEAAIPFETVQLTSANLARSTSVVTAEGQEGILQTVTKNTYIDGILTETATVTQTVTKEPVNQVVTIGTAFRSPVSKIAPEMLTLDNNGAPVTYTKVLTGKSAAYSAPAGAKTASGKTAQVGYVAVNPKVIPYGTKLYIMSTNGKKVYGYAIAADTGAALMDGRIMVDLFFDNYQSSCNWGIQQVNIYILE